MIKVKLVIHMKIFVASMLALFIIVASLGMTERRTRPAGGYLPITEVNPVEVQSIGNQYQLKFPMDLYRVWEGTVEYQLENWNLKYKLHGLREDAYVSAVSGPFEAPDPMSKRAYYKALVSWPSGKYDVVITVDERHEGTIESDDILYYYSVTIP